MNNNFNSNKNFPTTEKTFIDVNSLDNSFRPSLLKSFFLFLFFPEYRYKPYSRGLIGTVWDVVRLWAFGLSLAVLVGALIQFIMGFLNIPEDENHAITEMFRGGDFLLLFFLAVVWAPIAEELTFRMGFVYSPYRLSFSLVFIAFLFKGIFLDFLAEDFSFLPGWIFQPQSLGEGLLYAFLHFLTAIILGIVLGILFQKSLKKEAMDFFYTGNFRIIFYCSSFVFAIMHIFNYSGVMEKWTLIPFLVFPQFIAGLVLGYVRMNYGLKWGMLLHALHNGALIIPILLLSSVVGDIWGGELKDNLSDAQALVVFFVSVVYFFLFCLVFLLNGHLFWEFIKEKLQEEGN